MTIGGQFAGRPVRRKPTIKEVAARAGVSWKTVSNVVNDTARVSPATRARVEEAIRALGYHSSAIGRQLRSGRSHLLMLAIPELAAPYFAELAHEVLTAAAHQGYTVLITETEGDEARERAALKGFNPQFAEGVILSPISLDSVTVSAAERHVPVVLLGERITDSDLNHVIVDSVASGRDATRHLFDQGCRRVKFLGADLQAHGVTTAQLRLAGCQEAHAAAGRPFSPSDAIAVRGLSLEAGTSATRALLASRSQFDGLFCANDLLALGALRALHEANVAVPDDVAVIGWDNTLACRYSTPSLTTIAPHLRDIARHAVSIVTRQIEGHTDLPTKTTVGYKLIARESTARTPTTSQVAANAAI